jgi:hypothetical protein
MKELIIKKWNWNNGTDIAMLLKHYRRAITKTEAEAYYNSCPDRV